MREACFEGETSEERRNGGELEVRGKGKKDAVLKRERKVSDEGEEERGEKKKEGVKIGGTRKRKKRTSSRNAKRRGCKRGERGGGETQLRGRRTINRTEVWKERLETGRGTEKGAMRRRKGEEWGREITMGRRGRGDYYTRQGCACY